MMETPHAVIVEHATAAVDAYIDGRVAEFEELDLSRLERLCLIASARARRQSMIDAAVAKMMRFVDLPDAPSHDLQ